MSSITSVKYVSPHPPGNFHAIRDEPKLEGSLVGRVATSSSLMLGEIVDAGESGKWGKILDLLNSKIKLHDGVDSKDALVGAWIMIKNGDTILLRPDESSIKVSKSSPVSQKRPSDISTPWATPFHKKISVSEESDERTPEESEDVIAKSLNFTEKNETEEKEEETPRETTTAESDKEMEQEIVQEKMEQKDNQNIEETEQIENITTPEQQRSRRRNR